MRLDVTKALQAQGEELLFVCSEEVRTTTWDGAELRFVSPLEVRGVFTAAGDSVWVRAEVSARMCLPCANCLEDAYCDGRASMNAHFSRQPEPNDPDVFLFEGHTLELTDAALGALWLEMPMRILCATDCRGLCPVCGVNRNSTKCTCQKEMPSKHPFSALASLLNQDEEV